MDKDEIAKKSRRFERERVCKMLISTLNKSVYCTKKHMLNYKDYPFRCVEILGNVVSIKDQEKGKNLEIDDGTGTAQVFIENPRFDGLKGTEVNVIKECENMSDMDSAVIITQYSIRKFQSQMPCLGDVKLGDLLLVEGVVKVIKTWKTIFCTKFCRIGHNMLQHEYLWFQERSIDISGGYFKNINLENDVYIYQ